MKIPKRRKRPAAPKEILRLGIGWYTPAEWIKLKQVADDSAQLDDSYEAWLSGAERLEKKLFEEGIEARRVHVEVDELLKWCATRKKSVNSASRATFVTEWMQSHASCLDSQK